MKPFIVIWHYVVHRSRFNNTIRFDPDPAGDGGYMVYRCTRCGVITSAFFPNGE